MKLTVALAKFVTARRVMLGDIVRSVDQSAVDLGVLSESVEVSFEN